MNAKRRNSCRVPATEGIARDRGVFERRCDVAIDIGQIAATIEICVDDTVGKRTFHVASSRQTKLYPPDEATLGDLVGHTIRLVEHLKLIFGMIALVVRASVERVFHGAEPIPIILAVGPSPYVVRWFITIVLQLSVVIVTAIASAVVHPEGGTCSMCGNRLARHVAHFRPATVLLHVAVVYGHVNIAPNGIGTIDTTTVELVNQRVINLERYPPCHLVVASARHCSELATIRVAVRAALIVRRCNVRPVDAREVELRVLATYGVHGTQFGLRRVAHVRMGTRREPVHPRLATQQEVARAVGIMISHVEQFKLSTIDDDRRLTFHPVVVVLRPVILKLRCTHECRFRHLKMSLRHKDTYSVCILVMPHGKSQLYDGQEIKSYGLYARPRNVVSELKLQAVVRFTVIVQVSTHDSKRMPLFVKTIAHAVIAVLHLMIAYQHNGLIIDRSRRAKRHDGRLQVVVDRLSLEFVSHCSCRREGFVCLIASIRQVHAVYAAPAICQIHRITPIGFYGDGSNASWHIVVATLRKHPVATPRAVEVFIGTVAVCKVVTRFPVSSESSRCATGY